MAYGPITPTRVQLTQFLGNNHRLIAAFEALFDKNMMLAPSYSGGQLLSVDLGGNIVGIDDVATGNALLSGGVGASPFYGKVGLTTHVSGVLPISNGGTNLSTYSQGDTLYASASNILSKLPIGSANRWMRSDGAVPAWSASTLSNTWVSGDLAYASATNTLTGLAVSASGKFLQSNGTGPAWSVATLPLTAAATGTILRSDGAGWVASTPTYPNTATSGKLLRGDGTNIALTAASYPSASPAAGAFLRGDGTDWQASTLTIPNTLAANRVPYAIGTDILGGSANLTFNGTTLTPNTLGAHILGGVQTLSSSAYYKSDATNGFRWNNNADTLNLLQMLNTGQLIVGNGMVVAANTTGATIAITNTTAPSGNPTGGGYLWVESGALKFRGSAGTVTPLAAA